MLLRDPGFKIKYENHSTNGTQSSRGLDQCSGYGPETAQIYRVRSGDRQQQARAGTGYSKELTLRSGQFQEFLSLVGLLIFGDLIFQDYLL